MFITHARGLHVINANFQQFVLIIAKVDLCTDGQLQNNLSAAMLQSTKTIIIQAAAARIYHTLYSHYICAVKSYFTAAHHCITLQDWVQMKRVETCNTRVPIATGV